MSDTRVLLCDLDGVVWRRSEPVQGSIAALGDLIGAGWSVLFITNSSHDPAGHHLDRLLELGVPDGVEVLTSPMAAALLCDPGEVVLCAAGPGVREELARRGCSVLPGDVEPTEEVDAAQRASARAGAGANTDDDPGARAACRAAVADVLRAARAHTPAAYAEAEAADAARRASSRELGSLAFLSYVQSVHRFVIHSKRSPCVRRRSLAPAPAVRSASRHGLDALRVSR